MIRYKSIIVLALLFVQLSCKCDKNKTEEDKEISEFFNESDYIKERIKDVYYRFPSPDEMFSLIENSGWEYSDALICPVSNINKYLDSRSQSLNMGIYMADLAYIAIFKRYKESIEYLEVIYKLSDKLRISSAFNKQMLSRIENNMKNADSLASIFDDTYSQLVNYMTKNNKEVTFTLISVGGFIEFLHLSLNLVKDFSDQDPVIQRIFDQKMVFDNIIKFAKDYSDNEDILYVIKLLQPLEDFYSGLEYKETKTSVTKESDGKLVIGGGKQILIDEEKFQSLIKVVNNIRKEIISIN